MHGRLLAVLILTLAASTSVMAMETSNDKLILPEWKTGKEAVSVKKFIITDAAKIKLLKAANKNQLHPTQTLSSIYVDPSIESYQEVVNEPVLVSAEVDFYIKNNTSISHTYDVGTNLCKEGETTNCATIHEQEYVEAGAERYVGHYLWKRFISDTPGVYNTNVSASVLRDDGDTISGAAAAGTVTIIEGNKSLN